MIIQWFGNSTLPTGWALCDGTNGTPDLRNKFVIGAGNRTLPMNDAVKAGGSQQLVGLGRNQAWYSAGSFQPADPIDINTPVGDWVAGEGVAGQNGDFIPEKATTSTNSDFDLGMPKSGVPSPLAGSLFANFHTGALSKLLKSAQMPLTDPLPSGAPCSSDRVLHDYCVACWYVQLC
jgi:hypothetical protein